jgi:hypothetical protein
MGEGERDMGKVGYKVRSDSNWTIPMDLTTEVPDTMNPEGGSDWGMVRPNAIGLSIFPNSETGVWEVSSASAVGPKVKDGKVTTKRDYAIPFMDPLGSDSVAPDWMREVCQGWVDKANGVGGGGVRLTDQQVYDLSTRTKSSVGLENFRKVAEDVLGSKPAAAPEQPKDYARQAFDTALNGLLIRENLEGTQWAIEKLREMAEGPHLGAAGLHHIADGLVEMLDKRTAELAARGTSA